MCMYEKASIRKQPKHNRLHCHRPSFMWPLCILTYIIWLKVFHPLQMYICEHPFFDIYFNGAFIDVLCLTQRYLYTFSAFHVRPLVCVCVRNVLHCPIGMFLYRSSFLWWFYHTYDTFLVVVIVATRLCNRTLKRCMPFYCSTLVTENWLVINEKFNINFSNPNKLKHNRIRQSYIIYMDLIFSEIINRFSTTFSSMDSVK